jgi:hypothetical protein
MIAAALPIRPAAAIRSSARSSVGRFLAGIEDDAVRVDCLALIEMMRAASGSDPAMWSDTLVGFGSRLGGEGARANALPLLGFSPGRRNIALYLRNGLEPFAEDLARLGLHEVVDGCLRLRSLRDVDAKTLKAIFRKSCDPYPFPSAQAA